MCYFYPWVGVREFFVVGEYSICVYAFYCQTKLCIFAYLLLKKYLRVADCGVPHVRRKLCEGWLGVGYNGEKEEKK